MERERHRSNPINAVFGDSNLVLSILSFLYKKTESPHDFFTNTPIAMHILSFKSLYHEFHKFPNLQIESQPSQYISSFSVFQWAIGMGYNGNNIVNEDLLNLIVHTHKKQAIHFIDYIITTKSFYSHSYQIADYATTYGHLHLLEQIKLNNPTFEWNNTFYLVNAASGGYLQIMQWLRNQDPSCPWSTFICTAAAHSGHLHILQWLQSQNPPCPWNKYTCESATESGHLHILQWLQTQDIPYVWNEHTCTIAAESGHLHVLQWLREQDPPCPYNADTCESAARSGRA